MREREYEGPKSSSSSERLDLSSERKRAVRQECVEPNEIASWLRLCLRCFVQDVSRRSASGRVIAFHLCETGESELTQHPQSQLGKLECPGIGYFLESLEREYLEMSIRSSLLRRRPNQPSEAIVRNTRIVESKHRQEA
jgi:hypothetical protein